MKETLSNLLWNMPIVQRIAGLCLEEKYLIKLADGTLPLWAYDAYLCQNYVFLVTLRTLHLSAKEVAAKIGKSNIALTLEGFAAAVQTALDQYVSVLGEQRIEREAKNEWTKLYVDFLQRNFARKASAEDLLIMLVATTPCSVLYGWIGSTLANKHIVHDVARLNQWVQDFVSDSYILHVTQLEGMINELYDSCIVNATEEQKEALLFKLKATYTEAMELELAFFNQVTRRLN